MPDDDTLTANVSPAARGEVVGERFVIGGLAGTGGMGAVYQATDRTTGAQVALKLVHGDGSRFAIEARVLSELQHPAIVRYLAHGQLADGRSFLAMEWLDGEDLGRRLARGPLGIADALAIARRVADGLALAHRRGIVHRDVKPSNLFLVDGDPGRIKLLDFGVARLAQGPRLLTRTGAIIGSIGYMAPEQAIGANDVDARADVFALGCVLFECVTGQRVFSGEHIAAILAKVLREDAPRVSAMRRDTPIALDNAVARMLAKDRDARPRDGDAVIAELERVDAAPIAEVRVTTGEQRLACVMLAEPTGDLAGAEAMAARLGAELARLADGTLLVTLTTHGSATDQGARMASLALALHGAGHLASVAVATGRVDAGSRHPVGPAIDRAAEMLATARGAIRIDEVTASLLDARFEQRDGVLVGRRDVDEVRRLLGKRTPCVGRDKELAMLDATLAECIAEPVARAVLVTGPAGAGKSRLRIEMLARVRDTDAAVWSARADSVSAGSSHGIVRQLVRAGAGLRDGDPAADQQARLATHLARHFHGDELARTCEFLGELIGVPATTPSPLLVSARANLMVMGEWMRRGFESWVAAECATRPLVIVIEDLHWGDAASVAYLDGVLRRLADRPLLVVAFARSEVNDLFPRLWADASPQEIRLAGLTRRAAERLVRAVLGDDIAGPRLAHIVERSGGNAYYLEELIRHSAEGNDDLPVTILAMVESRLDRLEPAARRVLRAASVFGEVCWAGGVGALVDGDVAGWLRTLVDRELLSDHAGDRFPGEAAYAFRHALLRDASYAMLTDADRPIAHRLAADWLERAGEKDALVLANHFERGDEPARALPWLVRAVHAAYDGHQFESALALADRGIAHGIDGEMLGVLRRVQASAASAIGNFALMRERAEAAMAVLPRGKALWVRATGGRVFAEMNLGNRDATVHWIEDMLDAATSPALDTFTGFGLCIGVYCAHWLARGDLLRRVVERLETLHRGGGADPLFGAWMTVARLSASWSSIRLLGDGLHRAAEASRLFDEVGDVQGFGYVEFGRAMVYGEAGSPVHGPHLRAMRRAGLRAGYHYYSDSASFYDGRAWGFAGRFEDATRCAAEAEGLFRPFARGLVGWAELVRGNLDAAERGARDALAGAWSAFYEGIPTAMLAEIALARGRADDARKLADRGLATLAQLDTLNEVSWLRLVRARALHAVGDRDGARTAIVDARERILRIADTHDDPELRASYLANIVPNAQTLALASEWA